MCTGASNWAPVAPRCRCPRTPREMAGPPRRRAPRCRRWTASPTSTAAAAGPRLERRIFVGRTLTAALAMAPRLTSFCAHQADQCSHGHRQTRDDPRTPERRRRDLGVGATSERSGTSTVLRRLCCAAMRLDRWWRSLTFVSFSRDCFRRAPRRAWRSVVSISRAQRLAHVHFAWWSQPGRFNCRVNAAPPGSFAGTFRRLPRCSSHSGFPSSPRSATSQLGPDMPTTSRRSCPPATSRMVAIGAMPMLTTS